MPNGQFPEILKLADLNGQNDSKISGEVAVSSSGYSVSMAGDINGDGYEDILIGAPNFNGSTGRSYVVFGGPGVGKNGLLSLSNLNGINGFKLDGEVIGDNCGISVSSAGDVNGDSYEDLLIGAWFWFYNHNAGRSYVVFGGPGVGSNGVIALSSLNGVNGFKLDGENNDNGSDTSVSAAGDINSDGYDDLIIGAQGYPGGSSKGRSGAGDVNGDGVADILIGAPHLNDDFGCTYVIFGDIPPVLVNNTLSLFQGETLRLDNTHLAAYDLNHPNNSLLFIPTEVSHGQFETVTQPGVSIANFTQQQLTSGNIQFVHDDTVDASSYNMTVRSAGIAWTGPIAANITFFYGVVLETNQLTINQGQSVILTSTNLKASNQGKGENGDVSFKQQQVISGQVVFSSQNSAVPAYQVSVTDGRMATNPQPSNITFSWKPVLTRNQFLANRGQVTVLTTDNIAATRNGSLAKDLQFVVTGIVKHGRFELHSNPGNAIISFYQDDILQKFIQFAHDNSTEAPSYSLKVVDNQNDLSSDTQAGKTILIVNNYFPVNQGENLLIAESILNATGIQRQDDGSIVFLPITGTVQHGHFALTSSPNYPLTSFQQQQISTHEILFVPDSSAMAPSGYVTVSDGQTNGAQGTIACNVDFDVPPVLKKAYLKTSLGEQIKITDINLKATSQTSTANNLIFEISEISHGYFADNDDWQTPLNNFTQQRITDGNMIFITDQSGQSPQFKVSVWDRRLHCVGCPQQADVVFQGENTSGSSLSDAIKNTVITAVVSGIIGLLFFALRYKHSLSLQRNARPTIDGEEKETYPDTLLLPIAREIFSRIKITGCLGYIGKRDYNEYIGAVSTIVAALETKEVIQPNQWNSLPRPRKQRIIDAIAMHTKELVGNNRCCSTRTFTSFYRAEATPRMIRDQAETIADAVQETLSNRTEAKGSRSRSSVRLTSATSSLNEPQMKTPLLK